MRIGLFTDQYYPSISGVVTSIKMLYEGLTKLGHECFIFTSFNEKKVKDDQNELLHKNVINIHGIPYPFKQLKDYRFTLHHGRGIKVVKQYNLDIIHVHTEYSIAKLAIKASKKLHIPIVHTLHTLYSDYLSYFSPTLDKIAHDQLVKFTRILFTKPVSLKSVYDIVPTRKVKDQAEVYGLGTGYAKEIKVIPTGIELEKFSPKNFTTAEVNDLKKSLDIQNQFVFLYIGRLSKEKGIQTIIDAFAESSKNTYNTILLIVGGGPELDELKEFAKEKGVADKVRFTGFIEWNNVPIYYQLGDIFVTASQSETQGLTYVEALGSQTPVLVQKDDAIADLIEDYYNGIYFNGEEDLALKMTEIAKAPETLKTIKKNTLKSVKNYSKEQFSKNILAVYEQAILFYQENHKK